ncbi:hypothetical protein BU26DRAFT_129624 [Trematosphaeria pertusa]|uniref:Uncharacterized protein n=1 Tax=Trematosphaeria pertusa TaxID=390896 RepID=A0A6A6HXK2_9PLEO|nr:uncharacterized protein BU26DRAFT_129624 [Trematosphaeria pertusa]KAF2242619.1 hypothetical protein BU26DRAFT_129624 [Trematosphaeria pertusa]
MLPKQATLFPNDIPLSNSLLELLWTQWRAAARSLALDGTSRNLPCPRILSGPASPKFYHQRIYTPRL